MVIGRFNGDWIAHKFGNQRTLLAGGFIAGCGLTGGILIGHTLGVIAAWTIVGLGVSVTVPILFSAVGSIATKKYPGVIAPSEAVAMVSGVAYFGFIAGPPFMGFLADQISLRWAMLIPAAFYFVFAAGSIAAKE
jgi:MFS family permease